MMTIVEELRKNYFLYQNLIIQPDYIKQNRKIYKVAVGPKILHVLVV